MRIIVMLAGYLADLLFGDPYSFPHPVRYIGKLISCTERTIRKISKSEESLKYWGFLLWFVTVGATYIVTYSICRIFSFNEYIYGIINAFIIYTTLSSKCLRDEAKKIFRVLETGDIVKSRKQLSYIVGRDTSSLEQKEIIRATVETVAENTVDGIIAPMFYGFIFGAPGAMAYKAINTLDSMVGYKNEKYINLGFFSAKIDDIANYIPARISAVTMSIGALFCGFDFVNGFRISIRDRKNHKSPNCAYPEGAAAGSLGVQLGGTNIYFGQEVYKPTIGDKRRELENMDIVRMNRLMYATSIVTIAIFTIIATIFYVMI